MKRFWSATLGLTVFFAIALLVTLGTPLGMSLWHYHVGFLAIAILGLAAWPVLAHRRVATLTMAFSGIPAVATGAVMLYTVQFPWKEWVTWWHSMTSVVLVVGFLMHWLHNKMRLHGFVARMFGRDRIVGLPTTTLWSLALVAAWLTWTTNARGLFQRENYLALASWAIFAATLFAYGVWLLFRLPRLNARLSETKIRDRGRAMIDVSLWLSHWIIILTGFALLYLDAFLRTQEIRYVGKWWHTASSAAFLAFLALHIGFNARLLSAHARRLDRDLTR